MPIIDGALTSQQLVIVQVPYDHPIQVVLDQIATLAVAANGKSSRKPLRISIPSLGDASWGDIESHVS